MSKKSDSRKSKFSRFLKSNEFYLIEYLLSKVCQFLVYIIFIIGILALAKYIITYQ